MKCQIKYSVLFMKKKNNKFYVFLNIAIKNLKGGKHFTTNVLVSG